MLDQINKVICGDACDLLEDIPSETVDLVLTDPPYGIDFVSNMPVEGSEKEAIVNDGWKDALKLMRFSFRQYARVLKDGGVACIFAAGGGPRPALAEAWLALHETFGLKVETCLCWDRCDIGLGWRYRPVWEAILVAYKGDARKTWRGRADAGNILRYPRIIPKKGEHPTPKPPDLICRLVCDNSMEGGLVLDPFCGGGTVPFICEREKRRFLAFEKDPGYAKMAQERVDNERKQLRMFEDCGVITIGKQESLLGDDK
jgi:DNA modification methylase